MSQHVYTGTTDPTSAPSAIGDHYINTTAGKSFVSTGTSSSADWKATAGTGGGTGDVVGPAGATDGDIALFNGATGKIVKDSGITIPASGNAGTNQVVRGNDSRLSDSRTPTGHTHPASQISDASSAGQAIITAANAAAQRAALGLATVAASGSAADLTGTLNPGQLPALTGDVTSTAGSSATTIATGAVTDAKSSHALKPPVKAMATANVSSLSGTTTADGVSLATGDVIFLPSQTTASQNGPWVIAAGAWTRPTWWPSGGTVQAFAGCTFQVLQGTLNAGSVWYLTTTGAITIDTTSVAFSQETFALNNSALSGTLSALKGGTGVNASAASNGQLLIGNGSGFSLATITAGSNITVTNGVGTITISATGGIGSPHPVQATFDGQGSVVATATKKLIPVDATGNITAATVVGDVSGSVTITCKKYTPSGGSLGSATTLGTIVLSSAQHNRDTTLTGWTLGLTAGDVVEISLGGTIASVTKLTVQLGR